MVMPDWFRLPCLPNRNPESLKPFNCLPQDPAISAGATIGVSSDIGTIGTGAER